MKETLVVCAMNRNQRVYEAVNNWLAASHIHEIVLVDWSSRQPLTRERFPDPKVKIVRAEDQPYWNLARAYNLAATFVDKGMMCKMDADYRIISKFLKKKVPKKVYWRGDIRNVKENNEIYISGFVRLRINDFFAVNGYNERLHCYGYDDTDLYNRLDAHGLTPRWIPYGPIIHVPHPTTERVSNLAPSELDMHGTLRLNKESAKSNPWTLNDKRVEYDVKEVSGNVFVAKPIV